MHSLPILTHLEGDDRKIALCDSLLALAVKLSKEEYEMNDSTPDNFNRLPPNSSIADGRNETVRSLLISILDNTDGEEKRLEGIMPYISLLFKGLIGRCLFLTNIRGDFFGISPGDVVAGDIIVRFVGAEQSLFFRPKNGKHQVLGDGLLIYLTLDPLPEIEDSEAEIVLVSREMVKRRQAYKPQ
jgi:hypothetical protein